EKPKSGGKILNVEPGHVRSQKIINGIGGIAMKPPLGSLGPRADDHVVMVPFGYQPRDILRPMLAVAAHQDEKSSASCANAAFDSRPVANVVGVTDHVRAPGHRCVGAGVRGTVVDTNDLHACQPRPSG